MGLPRITSAQIEDAVGIYRAAVARRGGDRPRRSGRQFPYLNQDPSFDEDIPIMLVALGEKTLEFAGRVVDGVVLHTFFTDETLARVGRRGARAARSRPAATRRACGSGRCSRPCDDHIAEELRLRKLVGRLAHLPAGLRRPARRA